MPLTADWLREVCLAFPHTTEQVQWGCDLVFKVGGKMFAVTSLEPAPVCLSFKASSENFAELTERPNVIPAPYLARAQWVALQTKDAVPQNELAALLRESYDLVCAKLPKKFREALTATRPAGHTKTRKKVPSRKKKTR